MELKLEVRQTDDTTRVFGSENNAIMVTPDINEDYWTFRVKLYKDQAMLGFPKFSTIGIGFAQEEDWNTNLPYSCDTEKIFNHIKHNKLYPEISDDDCRKAIEMIQDAAIKMKKDEQTAEERVN